MKKILIINGPNLNMLGRRETALYGEKTLEYIEKECSEKANRLHIELDFFQSNSESEIIERIHCINKNYDALIINAGAFTHSSIAIYDSLKTLNLPFVEVHITNTTAREEFRQKSLISPIANGTIIGFGYIVYELAIYSFKLKWDIDES